eukprot:11320714-Alexandrium_andersonii.AAC.1
MNRAAHAWAVRPCSSCILVVPRVAAARSCCLEMGPRLVARTPSVGLAACSSALQLPAAG